MVVTLEQLQQTLASRFNNVLLNGSHEENGECCALELLSVCKQIPWTDNPEQVRSFDIRPINDIKVSNQVRTEHLLPVIAAYSDSLDWPIERQKQVVERIVILTVQRLIAALPGLSEEIRQQCRLVNNLDSAANAAAHAAHAAHAANAVHAVHAVHAANAAHAAHAANAAAVAAAHAAHAAHAANAVHAAAVYAHEKVFITACDIWLEATKEIV